MVVSPTCYQTTYELDIAIDIVPDEPKAKVIDQQGQGYMGTFLSKELSIVCGQNALDDPKIMTLTDI